MDSAGRLWRLTRKELSEILRDRRTIVTLVLMPLLLYPLLSFVFQQFFLASRLVPGETAEYRIGVTSNEDFERLGERVILGEKVLQAWSELIQAGATAVPKAPPKSPPKVAARVGTPEELEAALRANEIDVLLRPLAKPGAPRLIHDYAVQYLASSPGAQGALAYLETRLAAANERDLALRIKVPPRIDMMRLARAPLQEDTGAGSLISLASLVPLVLILMTITGAVYPAIDLTAGERERGTLEILVAAPVPRLGLLFAKYVSVWSVAVLTALVNLTAMTLTLGLSGLGPLLFGDRGLSFALIVQLFLLLLLFAAFFSAVLLCITSFARSFKEAQAYLIPLMLVSMAPGVIGMMPGLELATWAVAPLLNIVLLGRDLFEGNTTLGTTLLVVASTLIYAAAAIAVAARVFGAESVLYNEQSSWGDLVRRPETPQDAATPSAALWCLALMIPVNFVFYGVAIWLVRGGALGEEQQLFAGPVHALALFGVLPALFAWRGRLRWSTGFGLTPAPWPAYLGGVILGLSLWPIVFWIMVHTGVTLSDEQRSLFEQIAARFRTLNPAVKVTLVVIPALLEEWFFRGYLFGALSRRLRLPTVVVVTALLFGVTHVVFRPELGVARLLPSTLMGLALGGVRAASGSVIPCMLLHVCHNSVLVLLQVDPTTDEVPWLWVLGGAHGAVLGAGLVWLWSVRRWPANEPPFEVLDAHEDTAPSV